MLLSASFTAGGRSVARALPIVLLLLFPAPLLAQGVVAGRVVDERGVPIPLVRITLPALERVAVADDSGRFLLRGLPVGTHLLVATRLGWAPARQGIRLEAASDTLRPTITLRRSVVALAGVQVTATPSARDPLAVAQATSALEGRDLDRAQGATLGATLARTPGVHERWQGPAASAPVIRGLSGDRIVVLQDGQRTGDLAATAPDHGVTIDPTSASRVEVVRGPAALLYGSNAIGGVVNVVSEDIPVVRAERATIGVAASVESASPGGGTSVDVTTPVPGQLALRARAGWRAHDDLRPGAGASRLLNTQARSRQGAIGLARVGERGSVGLGWRGYDFAYGLPYAGGAENAIRLRGHRQELLGRAEWRADAASASRRPVESVRLEGNAQWYAHDELASTDVVGTALALRSQWGQLIARTGDLGRLRDGAIGAAMLLRQNGVAGAQALTPPNDGASVGAFAFQEVALGTPRWLDAAGDDAALVRQVRLPVGVRWDRHLLASRETARFGAARRRVIEGLSGSAGLTVPLAAGASLGVNLARALRAPTAEELYSQAGHAGTGAFEVGDPALGAEVTTGADAVLRVARAGISAQLAAYGARMEGFIGLRRALGPDGAPRDTTVSNAAGGTTTYPLYRVGQREVRSRGVEGAVEATLARHVVAGITADVVRLTEVGGAPVPFTPAARIGAHARRDDGRLSLGGGVRHALAQRRVPAGEQATGAYTLLDAHVAWTLDDGPRAHALTLRVDNLLDVQFRDAASRVKSFAPGPGRNVVVGWRGRW